ncbi:MAG: aminoglycoside phosphotransferase family protein, partial [Phycisphaeraceae bacterium]|nr:aminoglycoside phosphotransferase family protein [Phycisphaeraceae bacterium]
MPVDDAIDLFRPAGFRWWLSGGHALEAHLGRSWRDHDDTDIAISRSDAPRLLEALDGWDIHIGAAGVLTPWDGSPLDPDRSQNNLWCRPTPDSPWMIDVTVGDGNEHEWIYRRNPTIRRPWDDAVLTSPNGTPYLAPEIQLLFKSNDVRPKDDLDAVTVIPLLESDRRSWLANHLPAEHPWQTTIAGSRARLALDADADAELFAAGRSSQAWRGTRSAGEWVVRVPIPNSGRLISYRSEALLTGLLADAGQPVCTWHLVPVDDVECSLGPFLDGIPIDHDWAWPKPFASSVASILRELHQLPATGWGPLENRADRLHGTSPSATQGVVERWFHAPVWPFDDSNLDSHPLATLDPGLVPVLAALKDEIVDAATEPFGVVHSDLHRQHLLRNGDELAGILDFGDAFIGATAWDFALIHWYY